VQALASPFPVRIVDESLTHACEAAVQVERGSQVSPGSITPLLHTALQSLSVLALQPAGQHPSLFMHVAGHVRAVSGV
jgi:hypothetical protein